MDCQMGLRRQKRSSRTRHWHKSNYFIHVAYLHFSIYIHYLLDLIGWFLFTRLDWIILASYKSMTL